MPNSDSEVENDSQDRSPKTSLVPSVDSDGKLVSFGKAFDWLGEAGDECLGGPRHRQKAQFRIHA
jgi:hypothetical protein